MSLPTIVSNVFFKKKPYHYIPISCMQAKKIFTPPPKAKNIPFFLGCKMPGYPITPWLGQNFALIQGLHK
jgi:hypothetical protein